MNMPRLARDILRATSDRIYLSLFYTMNHAQKSITEQHRRRRIHTKNECEEDLHYTWVVIGGDE